MKKIILSLTLIVLSVNFAAAQRWNQIDHGHYEGDMLLGLGLNIVDDSGNGSKTTLSGEHYNFGGLPLTFSFEYYVTDDISVFSKMSINIYKEGKTINGVVLEGDSTGFFATDFNGRYSFARVLDLNKFDPYLALGFGFINIGAYTVESPAEIVEPLVEIPSISSMNLNTIIGFNYWVSKGWAINLDAAAKMGISNPKINCFQYGLGTLYAF
ncbi:MAG: hypothetical protein KAH07_02860 [Flavobacteriaceae bacterium]|nr:hypothetical protein [Flavobacteriaceae bacterium]